MNPPSASYAGAESRLIGAPGGPSHDAAYAHRRTRGGSRGAVKRRVI